MKRNYMDASPPLLRAYFGYQETIKGKSAQTVDEYFLDIRSFFRYYKYRHGYCPASAEISKIDILDVDNKMCSDVTYYDILDYLTYCSAELGNGAAARSRKCSSLRSFFAYLVKEDVIRSSPVDKLENPKLGTALPHFLSLDQSIDLLNAIEGENRERDYCIITLFLNCGMRLSELVGINYSDLMSDNRLRLRGKGNKERIIYLNQACLNALDAYRRVRPVDGVIDKDALFLSKRRRRISPKTVQWLVKKYLGDIGLNGTGYSVHKLRHTAATLMYDSGQVDIRTIKDILGHSDLGTTQIYTHVSDNLMKNATDANPLSRVRDDGTDSRKNADAPDIKESCPSDEANGSVES